MLIGWSSDNQSKATTGSVNNVHIFIFSDFSLFSAKIPIIVGIVASVVAVLFVLSMLYCIYRRQRRRATYTSPPVGEIQQYHDDAPSNNPQARWDALLYRYPSVTVPEIQSPEPSLYAVRYPISRHSSEDAYMNHANFNNITTHGPQTH